MKERPTVYCVMDEDGYVDAAYYEKSSAIEYCKRCMTEQLLDPRDWECYFRIDKVIVK